MAKLGETLSTTDVSVEGEADQPLGGVLTTKKVRIDDGSYSLLGPMLSTQELWTGVVGDIYPLWAIYGDIPVDETLDDADESKFWAVKGGP